MKIVQGKPFFRGTYFIIKIEIVNIFLMHLQIFQFFVKFTYNCAPVHITVFYEFAYFSDYSWEIAKISLWHGKTFMRAIKNLNFVSLINLY